MGRRGPAPISGKILKMRGSKLAKKRLASEPGIALTGFDVVLTPPSWLSAEAKVVFRLIVSHVKPMGILGRMDTTALGRYAVLFVQWRHAVKTVEALGQTYTTEHLCGTVYHVRPEMRIIKSLNNDLLDIEKNFGLTPAARSNFGAAQLALAQPKDMTGKDRFFQN